MPILDRRTATIGGDQAADNGQDGHGDVQAVHGSHDAEEIRTIKRI